MLLKLTCPSCGRSDQASDRVIGKEVRCPCGATFRVLGPKQGGVSAANLPTPRPEPVSPQYSAHCARLKRDRDRRLQTSLKMRHLSARDQSQPGANQPCQDHHGPKRSTNQRQAACLHGLMRLLAEPRSCL